MATGLVNVVAGEVDMGGSWEAAGASTGAGDDCGCAHRGERSGPGVRGSVDGIGGWELGKMTGAARIDVRGVRTGVNVDVWRGHGGP